MVPSSVIRDLWSVLPLLQLALLALIIMISLSLPVPCTEVGSSLQIPGLLLGISFRAHSTAEGPPFSVGKPRQS